MYLMIHMPLSDEAIRRVFGHPFCNERILRKKLAEMSTRMGLGIPEIFFGYKDGVPRNGFQPFGIGTYPRGLRFLANGRENVQTLREIMPLLHSAIIRETGCLVLPYETSGEHAFDLLPYHMRYYIDALAVGTENPSNRWVKKADEVNSGKVSWLDIAGDDIRMSIARGLWSQMEFLTGEGDEIEGNIGGFIYENLKKRASCIEARGNVQKGGGEMPSAHDCINSLCEALDVTLHNVVDHTHVRRSNHSHMVLLRKVEFRMKARISQAWQTGRGRNHGFGLVMPAARAWAMDQEVT